MGATVVSDPEAQPLLKPLPEPVKETREWKGHWAAVGGDCSAPDVAACCLTLHAPWIAFGWNSSRGLGLTWWKEALKMFLLTTVVFAVLRCGMCALTHMRCMPHDDMGPHAVGPHSMDLPSVTPGNPGSGAVLPANLRGNAVNPNPVVDSTDASTTTSTTTTTLVDAATSTEEDDDDDAVKEDPLPHPHHHHKHDEDHHHKHDEDHHHKHEEKHDDKADADAKPDGKHRGHEEEDHDEDEEEDDDDDVRRPHPFFWHPRHHVHDDDDMMMLPEDMDEDEFAECMATKVAPWALLMFAVAISFSFYFVYLAALRRRMIREKFGIAGEFRHDVLLWAGCAPCALAQETRTLMANRVEEGVWHGPAPSFAQAPTAPIMVA